MPDARNQDTLDLSELRRRLREERSRLEALLAPRHDALAEGSGELAHLDNHPADSSGVLFEAEKDATLREMRRQRLLRVEAALARLEEGSYGRCVRCGGPIPPARLVALPWVDTCAACQDALAAPRSEDDRHLLPEEVALDPAGMEEELARLEGFEGDFPSIRGENLFP